MRPPSLTPRLAPPLLPQADVLAGVFASTFVKSALQLGAAQAYITLDTFPWCPLLRCYWGWRDLCHNCEVCMNQAGGGEACGRGGGYHTAGGLRHALRDDRPIRRPFRRYMALVAAATPCKSFADHPMASSLYDTPVMCSYATKRCEFAPALPSQPGGAPLEVRHDGAVPGCAFRRFAGVDNALEGRAKPSYGYGTAQVQLDGGGAGAPPSLEACERRCCAEELCHSVVWLQASRTCLALLAIAHGARRDDWCWRPVITPDATTSIRLPGTWEARAIAAASRVLRASTFVRRGDAPGPRVFSKRGRWNTPAGHEHPLERSIEAVACERSGAARSALEVSEVLVAAIPQGDPRPGKPKRPPMRCAAS